MIFIGDIAIPKGIDPKISKLPEVFKRYPVVANLEGPIVRTDFASTAQTILFNDESVVEFLKSLNVKAVSLGNNHITDVPEAFQYTKRVLDSHGIARCGAGDDLEEASRPAIIDVGGEQYAFLSFGWDVINCSCAKKDETGCNPLSTSWVLNCIKDTRDDYPNAKIVVLPHWNYELELYPQPMHRELARLMIDAGAHAIFGTHPHCANGIEVYKGAPIVYSLGNWLIPDGVYFNARLKFPQLAKLQLAVEWTGTELVAHWFEYKPSETEVRFIESAPVKDCPRIRELTPYLGMDTLTYINWFKKNRRKKKVLPIFKFVRDDFRNWIKKRWVLRRQKLISFLLRMHLKSGPE